MKQYKQKEFPRLILDLVDLFAVANHKMKLMKDCSRPSADKFYSDAYNELANNLKKLEVIMLDEDEVEFLGPEKKLYRWSRINPSFIFCIEKRSERFQTQKNIQADLPMKEFALSELPELFLKLRDLLRPYLNQFKMLENIAGNEADDFHSKLYNDLYYQIKELGVIMICDTQVEVKTENKQYYTWNYHHPEFILLSDGTDLRFQNNNAQKIYLNDLKNSNT